MRALSAPRDHERWQRTARPVAALLSALVVTLALTLPASGAQASGPDSASGLAAAQAQGPPGKAPRPRVIATTDGEQDDLASMHRFILYADELDVAGIIQSSSRFHH